MKKVERLRFVANHFGAEFVLPYQVCLTWKEIKAAATKFESQNRTWGMRTDFTAGSAQGFGLPFLHHGSLTEAKSVWEKFGHRLIYIVSHNVLRRRGNFIARPVCEDYIFVEYSTADVQQREMYLPEHVSLLRQVLIGPIPHYCPGPPLIVPWWRVEIPNFPVISPESHLAYTMRFDTVYHLLVNDRHTDELTCTVAHPSGKLVIW